MQIKRTNVDDLIQEFAAEYATTDKGRRHLRSYAEARRAGQANWAEVKRRAAASEPVHDLALLKLLPHRRTSQNRERGAWLHVAPAITKDIKSWFEGAGWARAEDWPDIGKAVFAFVDHVMTSPDDLAAACNEFQASPFSKGIQVAFLTPILNALHPERFMILNKKPVRTLRYFTGEKASRRISGYPEANDMLKELARMLAPRLEPLAPGILLPDVFDAFCHYLIGVKKIGAGARARRLQAADEPDSSLRLSKTSSEGPTALGSAAFDLLAKLHATPTLECYAEHKAAMTSQLEKPLQDLLRQVVSKLPPGILDFMESQDRLFSRIPKNDFGRGGAWDFYWGALYPKGGQRLDSAQLFIRVDHDGLSYGFGLGQRSGTPEERFLRNWKLHRTDDVLEGLERMAKRPEAVFGAQRDLRAAGPRRSLDAWTADPSAASIRVAIELAPKEVATRATGAMVDEIAETFEALFPLVLLAASDAPATLLDRYFGAAEEELQPEYTLEELAEETYKDRATLEGWLRSIERKGQAIFFGPPGTGKTFIANRLARHLVAGGDGLVELLQFHPAYAYEDFIQGIRPRVGGEGKVSYEIVAGRFKDFCARAAGRAGTCVLVIDEINRANLARVFGELMYLLEYRDESIPLAGGGTFRIPGNVRILGTMNTADRSIALVDHALRRRFAFIRLAPDYALLAEYHRRLKANVEPLVDCLKNLNRVIDDPHYEVGVSFFLRPDLDGQLEDIWRCEIEPYLEELFFADRAKFEHFSWDRIREAMRR